MMRRSLIDLDDLSDGELIQVLDRAAEFKAHAPAMLLKGSACANLFFEPSTRTNASFQLAQQRLGAHIINLEPERASLATKGESLEDTVITLAAMGINVLVVRHSEAGIPARLSGAFKGHVVNAGDGTNAHPTQALLDLRTLLDFFSALNGRHIVIVGDVLHSRVAHSTMRGALRLGARITLVGPEEFLPEEYRATAVTLERDLDGVLATSDAVILLRVQRERFESMPLDDETYRQRYQLSAARLAKLPTHAIIMHPGPYNRGIELTDEVLTHPGWRYTEQIANGVAVRMAVLDFLVNGTPSC